jgi:pyrophosphatase PpaX
MTNTTTKFNAILFDLDGTLLDSREAYYQSFKNAFHIVLGMELKPEDRDRYMSLPTTTFLDLYASGEQRIRLEEEMTIGLNRIFPIAKLFQGMDYLLPTLRDAGCRLAVVTSQNQPEMDLSRRVLKIDHWIDAWICVDDSSQPKPHPEPVKIALHRLDARPEEAIMIGDTIYDLMAGRNAGVRTGAACWGAANPQALIDMHPDYVFYQPEDLMALVS